MNQFLRVVFSQLLFLLLFLPRDAGAQMHQELGISGGIANYRGDLQPDFFPGYGYKPMGGLLYKYFMNPNVGLRFGVSYTNLTAADSLSGVPANMARNLSFATHLSEVHGALEINFLPFDTKKDRFTPYIFGGIALFYYNPYALDPSGGRVDLRPLCTEGEGLPMYPDRKLYSLFNMAFPFGGGLKCMLRKKVIVAAELGFRYTNTGYLDDVSKSYVDLDSLQAHKGILAKQMSYRGNTAAGWSGSYPTYGTARGNNNSNDWYWYGNITVTIFLRSFRETGDYIKTICPNLFK